jgi:hypothetical protein
MGGLSGRLMLARALSTEVSPSADPGRPLANAVSEWLPLAAQGRWRWDQSASRTRGADWPGRARGATYRLRSTPSQSTRGLLEAGIASRSAGYVGQILNEPVSDQALWLSA